MKKICARLITVLGALLLFTSMATAGDSISISMSCTIPAIPGVNAPQVSVQATEKEAATDDSPSMLQKDAQEQVYLADGKVSSQRIETFYYR